MSFHFASLAIRSRKASVLHVHYDRAPVITGRSSPSPFEGAKGYRVLPELPLIAIEDTPQGASGDNEISSLRAPACPIGVVDGDELVSSEDMLPQWQLSSD